MSLKEFWLILKQTFRAVYPLYVGFFIGMLVGILLNG